ncbi:AGE family epimerase/isomerase [Thermopirellula anaerolimosa]
MNGQPFHRLAAVSIFADHHARSVPSRAIRFLAAVVLIVAASGKVRAESPESLAPTPDAYRQLADRIETHFLHEVLPFWFPRCVDREHQGFHPHFTAEGSQGPVSDRTIVFQARMTWLAAEVARRYPDLREPYADYARHGLRMLRESLWDREQGGFYWGVTIEGRPLASCGTEKHLYGTAFGIYAAANVYRATQDPQAWELAHAAFVWLEEHARDREHGGYFEAFARDGTPLLEPPVSPGGLRRPRDLLGTPYGYKSMNSHIHILEAVTELYLARPDPEVGERLRELLSVVRDKIAVPPGCLNLYFTPDWRPVPDHDSFGHDVETAFLILEAAEVLGEGHDPRTEAVARTLVDHALEYGWDDRLGGFFDRGFAFAPAYAKEKIWWTQAEGLNALLLMHERFGEDDARYWDFFCKQWDFIRRRQIHPQWGEWYDTVTEDGKPLPDRPLGHIWKAGYHNGRALMRTAERLRHLAERAPGSCDPDGAAR